MSNSDKSIETVKITVDDQVVEVPKGTNLIEAAKVVGSDIPYYCYHRHLSVAGNCRMCQVELVGAPKLTIACNTAAQEGMEIRTHKTSDAVREAQRATLEFLLINHPLDCTVCDQAGHCKLQDYYFDYNSAPSRFIEDKSSKVKAEVLGPDVIYDAERCIMCTRCVRFCDEVSETSELSVLNRGDKTRIAIHPAKPLDNELSGCVVDLCPVGALTHRRWRFNTRIWYTNETDTICTGCSTGCSAKVAVRDGEVVGVKGRLNSEVNNEWLCNEGRYGFSRFQPKRRLTSAYIREGEYLKPVELEKAYNEAAELKQKSESAHTAVFLSPFLTLEEVWLSLQFTQEVMGLSRDSSAVAMQFRKRQLNDVEKKLVSPDFSPNARAMHIFGYSYEEDWAGAMQHRYQTLLSQVRSGSIQRVLLVGYNAILDTDVDERLINSISEAKTSVAITPSGLLEGEGDDEELSIGAHQFCKVLLPGHSVHEKSGVMVNRDMRLQRLNALMDAPAGTQSDWRHIASIAEASKKKLIHSSVSSSRELYMAMIGEVSELASVSLAKIGSYGISWDRVKEIQSVAQEQQPVAETRV